MPGFHADIERDTLGNEDYRRVVFTGKHTQLVYMSIPADEEIGEEVHDGHDQFIRVEAGIGTVTIDGDRFEVRDGSAVVIPAGARHNVVNESPDDDLKLYTLYSPPEHPDGLVERTKGGQ
jgi:mannose-6-phosphate isomerase-like protein (cupin superfamily)